MNPQRIHAVPILLVLLLAGCGRGASGVPVAGSVSVDGAPLPWGQVYLHGKVDAASNTSHAVFEVRDGHFGTAGRLPEGQYEVSILVYDGAAPPASTGGGSEASAAPEPTVVGEWKGAAKVSAGAELKFDIIKSELQKPS